jgi:hypothetical protein
LTVWRTLSTSIRPMVSLAGLASALSFFNSSYASGSLPSVESLHKFRDPELADGKEVGLLEK